jgi:Fe-S cluster assembly ATPase SufC
VHIYADGRIIKTGDMALAEELETGGYKNYLDEA